MGNYFSQFKEDEWMDKHLPLPAKGFYVDIGAAYPEKISNTAFLRAKGWQGVQIDANPDYSPLWKAAGHELTVGIIWTENEAPFLFHPSNSDISGVNPYGPLLPSIQINQFLQDKGVTQIDLLNIDVEGAEFDILNTLDWDAYKPKIVVWEFNTNGQEDHRLCQFLESKGYKQAHKTYANYIHILA